MTTRSRDTDGVRRGPGPPRSGPATTGSVTDATKRVAAAVLGGILLVRGLRRRSLRGIATALAGGWLLSRAFGGRPGIERALRSLTGGRAAGRTAAGGAAVSRSITVGRPAEECYEVWRDPDRLSRILDGFAEVDSTGDDRLRWTVHGPRGRDVSWETRVVAAEPGELVRWETTPDARVHGEGSVRFRPAPGDRGTVVTLSFAVDPPGGAVGTAALERLDVVPETLAGVALDRFESLVETGEIPTLESNPSARGSGDLL